MPASLPARHCPPVFSPACRSLCFASSAIPRLLSRSDPISVSVKPKNPPTAMTIVRFSTGRLLRRPISSRGSPNSSSTVASGTRETRPILNRRAAGMIKPSASSFSALLANAAAAGASLEHSHSQLIALPIVPDFVREELEGARQHYQAKERCVFCDIVRQEISEERRIIQEDADIVAISPYAPRFPFETWILPRRHGARFEDAPRHEFEGLARMVKSVLGRMNRTLEQPSYNMIIHSAPFTDDVADYYHWHIELMPKLTRTAGFEWGTGFYINPTSPEEATEVLRNARLEAVRA